MASLETGEATLPAAAHITRERFTFTDTAREYFGIWIVNMLLTILTLGIYSAWAKVRRQRYFYGNTHLAGASFEYHARPIQILVGRAIVLTVIVAYNLALNFVPVVGSFIGVAFLFAVPWFVMRGLRFSARVTSYRTVRFDFTGTYWGAFQAYVLGWALMWGTLGILAPLASQWMWSYTLGNLRYGNRPIACDPRLEKLFGQWWLPALLFVGGGMVVAVVALAVTVSSTESFGDLIGNNEDRTMAIYLVIALLYLALLPFLLLYLICGLIYAAGTRNVALNETLIDGRHVLHSAVGRGRYVWIAITNLLATLATLGLLRPWAAVRMARYLAGVTALDTTGSLDVYAGTARREGGAAGSEYLEVEGFDLGF